MLVHNTTYHVDKAANSLFVHFLKENYIPRSIENSIFSDPRLLIIRSHVGDDSVNYSLQFKVNDMGSVDQWFKEVGDNLNRTLTLRFGNEVLGFTTILEEVNLA